MHLDVRDGQEKKKKKKKKMHLDVGDGQAGCTRTPRGEQHGLSERVAEQESAHVASLQRGQTAGGDPLEHLNRARKSEFPNK